EPVRAFGGKAGNDQDCGLVCPSVCRSTISRCIRWFSPYPSQARRKWNGHALQTVLPGTCPSVIALPCLGAGPGGQFPAVARGDGECVAAADQSQWGDGGAV